MKFKPMTDDELAATGLLQAGVYDFEITSAEEKVSKKGNDMLEIKLNVFEPDGTIRPMRDWIMPQMAKKFKHFHNATGMMDKYESGDLAAADVVGKTGKCMIKIGDPTENKDGISVRYNQVDDYVKKENLINTAIDLDDDIPF